MTSIGKLWAGNVYGTNTGRLFIEFIETEPNITGVLRFMDSSFGLTVYEISAVYGDKISITGKPKQAAENVLVGDLTAEAEITPEGNLRGKWQTTLGTGGTFDAFPHDTPSPNTGRATSAIPEQIHTKYVQLGAIRLFSRDVEQLFNKIKQDFTTGRLIVTYSNHSSGEVTDYAENFLKEKNLKNLTYLKAAIQEPEAYGINRGVTVELRAHGSNDIRVQGVQESWVIGKAQALAAFLRSYERMPVTAYKKFGLNFNQFIFFAMLVMMPSIGTIEYRAAFAFSIILLLSSLLWVHSKFVPNASISMSEKVPNLFERNWPSVVSWLMAIVAGVVASFIFSWITQTPPLNLKTEFESPPPVHSPVKTQTDR